MAPWDIYTAKGQEYWSINETVRRTGYSRRTIYNWMKDKKVIVARMPGGKPYILKYSVHPKIPC